MSPVVDPIREKSGRLPVGQSTLEYRLCYPFFSRAPRISARYAAAAAAYEDRICRRYLPDLTRMPPHALPEHLTVEQSCEIPWNKSGLLSVFRDTYEDLGPYRRSLGRSSEVWDLQQGRQVGFDRLFKQPAQVRRILSEHILSDCMGSPDGCYFPKFPLEAPRYFYLSQGGLAVWYQPEQIAARSAGIPTFLIPWSRLASHVNFQL